MSFCLAKARPMPKALLICSGTLAMFDSVYLTFDMPLCVSHIHIFVCITHWNNNLNLHPFSHAANCPNEPQPSHPSLEDWAWSFSGQCECTALKEPNWLHFHSILVNLLNVSLLFSVFHLILACVRPFELMTLHTCIIWNLTIVVRTISKYMWRLSLTSRPN